MTPEPEMTLSEAKRCIAELQKFNRLGGVEREELNRWEVFLAGHAAGLKESQAVVKELVKVVKSGRSHNPDCLYHLHKSYPCPHCEALESAKKLS